MTLLKRATRILIVEDHEDSQRHFRRALERLDYSHIEVNGNGATGIVKARDYKPHLLFLDTNLPGLMGYEACQKIREEPWGRQMGIIGMSGNISPDARWQGAGSDELIQKYWFYQVHPQLDVKIQDVLKKYF